MSASLSQNSEYRAGQSPYLHLPVLVNDVVKYLLTSPRDVYVDGTVGTGGHSEVLGRLLDKGGHLICLDRDPDALSLSKDRLAFLESRLTLVKGNYREMDEILEGLGTGKVAGILLDLGMSSYQLDRSGRGFSFSRDEPLDMRMDPEERTMARELINQCGPAELERILREYGEEKRARLVARAIERARRKGPIESTMQLSEIIKSALFRYRRPGEKHPATRTFQALRIAVNRELENLGVFLGKAPDLIKKGGRLVVLSYHSLEDRMLKKTMRQWEKGCECPPDFPVCRCGKEPLFRRLTKRGVRPGQKEIEENPRARSAILRAAERL
ncbi:MAG: 16S rRNA (cytosine(1402)-N(4))-methyltransferase RsmH [Deltaproteobacteria bacterium]|nr:16S rRNA (cytosine(1402)-N(4))-methyltransferase RsmH [Deltaproteobacteria bacterium]MBW2136581.1 16S rRNA (cytosine(1402)-N(4))-methyltransferase RsmH [Deltaproteobacteria bacterium]